MKIIIKSKNENKKKDTCRQEQGLLLKILTEITAIGYLWVRRNLNS